MSRHRGTLSLIAWQMLLSWAYIFPVTLAICTAWHLVKQGRWKSRLEGEKQWRPHLELRPGLLSPPLAKTPPPVLHLANTRASPSTFLLSALSLSSFTQLSLDFLPDNFSKAPFPFHSALRFSLYFPSHSFCPNFTYFSFINNGVAVPPIYRCPYQ